MKMVLMVALVVALLAAVVLPLFVGVDDVAAKACVTKGCKPPVVHPLPPGKAARLPGPTVPRILPPARP